jgi:predicted NAD/FAD-binding protein
MKIAIVGSGISGLGCAHALMRDAAPGTVDLTLYEAEQRLGGHTNTVDIDIDGQRFGVDTGFLVFNERTYPNLIALFAELGVPVAKSDMSFAVSLPVNGAFGSRQLEWSGSSLATVFAQWSNALRPQFLSMLADILRFNRQATALASEAAGAAGRRTTLGEFLDDYRYGTPFRRWYLLPMAGAIWSCPLDTMLAYPVGTFVRFCHNHGLLRVNNRPQWFTVAGGARRYVDAIAAQIERRHRLRRGDAVQEVRRIGGRVQVASRAGTEIYDQVVFACHSDQARRLLRNADPAQAQVLEDVRYQPNRAILHTDTALLPQSRKVWAAWNYISSGGAEPDVSVSYLLNKLQPLPVQTPIIVTLNPIREPRPETVLAAFDYEHPIFDSAAVDAQRRLPEVQGRHGLWFAGAWTGYGFHEDGLKSGLAVADTLTALARQRLAA